MKNLTGKSVLITGAASGIGKATAIAFAREGADPLAICDINSEGLAGTTSEIENLGRGVLTFTVDVSDFEAVREIVDVVLDKIGRIDVLVNIAGWGILAPIEVMDLSDWKGIIDVDLYGIIHTVHAVYPHMLERKSGHIVNIASVDGLFCTMPYIAPYTASKFGVVGLSEALMLEASIHGIGVTCICPGAVKTPAYDSGPIKGFKPGIRKFKNLFFFIAEEPESTARSIVKAVKKNKFLVVTTPFMRISHFLRRYFPGVSYRFAHIWPRWFAWVADRYRI